MSQPWPIAIRDDSGVTRLEGDAIGTPNGGSQSVSLYRVKLTDDQIKALPTTPITLVAGVAGKMIWPLETMLICDTTEAAYTNILSGVEIGLGYGSPETNLPQWIPGNFITDTPSGVLNSVTDLLTYQGIALAALRAGSGIDYTPNGITGDVQVIQSKTYGVTIQASDEAPYDGLALQLQAVNGDGMDVLDFTGGNAANSLIVAVTYALIDLA